MRLTLALAQLNPTVGDIEGNVNAILAARKEAAGADMALFPEMAITGYPPEDLVLRPSFQQEAMEAVTRLADATRAPGPALLVGGLWADEGQRGNAVFLLDEGKLLSMRVKCALPNYGVFDEQRVFTPGPLPEPMLWRGVKLGVLICEEMWHKEPVAALAKHGVDLGIALNASPYEMGKAKRRRALAAEAVSALQAPLIYLNMVGGQDELVFDGRSFAVGLNGQDACRLPAFQKSLALMRFERGESGFLCTEAPWEESEGDAATVYQALVLGLRDYATKNRFPGVTLGLSGGIDSGLTAAIAADALGSAMVRCVMLPSRYTSAISLEDAAECARLLGVPLIDIPIAPGMQALDAMLTPSLNGPPSGVTAENIQARLRGMALMALSNAGGELVLTTGNKSELSVGYSTLYGDMCGGFSVLKDIYKTTVWSLARWRNAHRPKIGLGPEGQVVPERMITRPPTAELRDNQKDEDSLPPYPMLDALLCGLVEERLGVDDMVKRGHDRDTAVRVLRMVTRAEYKRRQAAPGVKVTGMSFGRDWRYPITNRFRN